jgi:acyl-CoA dehydrogenase
LARLKSGATTLDNERQFAEETRAWLEENCPVSMRIGAGKNVPSETGDDQTVWGGRSAVFPNPDAKLWLERMGAKGWTCPTWPSEYGGGGLNKEQNSVLQQELARIKARPALTSFGISMLGPVLLEFGNEAQKQLHLPQIVKGEIRWCQGYSEPGSGSDLASLQTKAILDGDHYVINGSKVWTSYANDADWIFCLVRTNFDVPKHNGISFILFDMTSTGVSTKPIQLISGASPFCETFFDDVKVARENLVGPLNDGWEKNKKIADVALRDSVVRHQMNGQAFAATMKRSVAEAKLSTGPSATSSMFKYYGTEQNKNRYEVMLEIMGTNSLGWEGDQFDGNELSTTREWLRSKANSIEGGTSEVQLNIIAKRVLALPD